MASLLSETSTVVSDILDDTSLSGDFVSEVNVPPVRVNTKGKAEVDDLVATMDDTLEERPFFIRVGKDGIVAALEKLDEQLVAAGHNKVLSTKKPIDWTGKEIIPGRMGLINHGGLPKILTRPGRYPGFPLRNWWARSWCGTTGASDTVIEFQGLTIVQVSQNQAAVVSDPQNHIFVIKNSGFVAFAVGGTYDVLSVVDMTHLPMVVTDPLTKVTLGWTHEVKMASNVGGVASKDYVVATFLNIPARNCAILQKGDDLVLLGAGQSVITNPSVTLHGLYTLGDNQLEMPTKEVFTRDEVPISLRIYLGWQLTEPLKLATRGYWTAYDILRDKTQSILTHIAGHLDYSAMIKSKSPEGGVDTSSAFLGSLQSRTMNELHEAALGYGIVLKDLAIIDCRFKCELAHTLNTLTTRVLQAQVEGASVDRENSNNVKQEEGALAVTHIKAQAAKIQADSEAYQVIATAKAQAERTRIETQAQAEAIRLTARAEADAILTKAQADSQVLDQFSREMEVQRVEVAKVRANQSQTIFIPTDGAVRVEVGNALASGSYL